MKLRIALTFILCLVILATVKPARTFAAKEQWAKVVSSNFIIISDAGEGEAQKVAAMLEQFRHTTLAILPQLKTKAAVPTKVFHFRSHDSFRAFKPKYKGKVMGAVNGYFFGDGDQSFIALTTDAGGGQAYEVIFHEYQHFILSNILPNAPLWLDEGLAEFYSAFEPRFEGREVLLGRSPARHVLALRKATLMPFEKLFSIDTGSPEYNEAKKAGLFYAQSWALAHYLMLGNNGKRQPQFTRFINSLGKGQPVEESFRQAFQADYQTIEKELQDYIASYMFPATIYDFPEGLSFTKGIRSVALSREEAEFHLGDLLFNFGRFSEAEPRLQKAAEKDANCAECQIALGALRFRQRRYPEAKKYLQAGLSLDPQNYRGHHIYANLLREEGSYDDAIKAYERALGVNPNLANVHLGLSIACIAAGQRQKGDEAFDQALKLSARGDAHYRARGYAMLLIGRGEQAANDSLTFIKRRGWQDDSAPKAALVAYLGYRMDKLSAEAAKVLEELSAKADSAEWPYPVIKYLKREIDAQQLVSSAKDADQLTEAHTYIGMNLSFNGDRNQATTHLQWVKEKGNQALVEYEMAWGELKRIERGKDEKARD
ncbi:MAG TPA: tetratricopeptide repeat protein [Blastocatellia bacterium]|nr:tetratricopeptide repeat protein [Blastocatellia bacterium]